MKLEVNLKQTASLTPQMIQSIQVLQMNTMELERFVEELAQENPVVELAVNDADKPGQPVDDKFQERLAWLEQNDRQNAVYYHMQESAYDPLELVGTEGGLEETLQSFLLRQLEPLPVRPDIKDAARYLVYCLEDSGYLSIDLHALAQESGFSLERLQAARDLLCTLEPAGVGATNLSECLALQLARIGQTGPVLEIVRHHLEQFAKKHHRAIMQALGISQEDITQAQNLIRELEPRPGSVFGRGPAVQYVVADIVVTQDEQGLRVQANRPANRMFRVSHYYRKLLQESGDQDVRAYLSQKMAQAEQIQRAIDQRETTLMRCAKVMVEHQAAFFQWGTQAMRPLSLGEVAQVVQLHESTVSRAIRDKYLQCKWGVLPMAYLLSRKLVAQDGQAGTADIAVKERLRKLIEQEPKQQPLSDQALAQMLETMGLTVSRRTVAKYRQALGFASAAGRKKIPN